MNTNRGHNKPAAPNPAIASRLQTEHHGRGVAEPGRSAASASAIDALRLGVFATLRFAGVDFNAETQRRRGAKTQGGLGQDEVVWSAHQHGIAESRGTIFLSVESSIAETDATGNSRRAV